MLKLSRPLTFGAAAVLFAALAWLVASPEAPAPPPSGNGTLFDPPGNVDGAPGERGALDLALKTINLSQGEGGFELWRLKAEWANMYKQEGLIFVVQPRLTYFLREEGKIMYVRSEKGDIDQEKHILRFVENVHVTQEDKELAGELLVYDGRAKTMTLPSGGDFRSSGSEGRADVIVWRIEHQHITGTGNVRVDMASPPPPEDAGRNSASEAGS